MFLELSFKFDETFANNKSDNKHYVFYLKGINRVNLLFFLRITQSTHFDIVSIVFPYISCMTFCHYNNKLVRTN